MEIVIKFQKSDLVGEWSSCQDCPLARAVKRQLNPFFISVGFDAVVVRMKEGDGLIYYRIKNNFSQYQLWWAKKFNFFGLTFSKGVFEKDYKDILFVTQSDARHFEIYSKKDISAPIFWVWKEDNWRWNITCNEGHFPNVGNIQSALNKIKSTKIFKSLDGKVD